jgi:multidrug transporter EmrE-like cation transporter
MSALPYLGILFAACMNAAGAALLKYTTVYRTLAGSKTGLYVVLFLCSLTLFGGAFPFYSYGLSRLQLSVAQPVFTVGTYGATAIVAVFAFHEPYSLLKIGGLAVVIAGVLMIANG